MLLKHYSSELDRHLHKSLGLTRVMKRDLSSVFGKSRGTATAREATKQYVAEHEQLQKTHDGEAKAAGIAYQKGTAGEAKMRLPRWRRLRRPRRRPARRRPKPNNELLLDRKRSQYTI
jgi:hypothetical protein